jgi:transcription elongation factor Elf1
MVTWHAGQRTFYSCIMCERKTSTTTTSKGYKNSSGMCKTCRKEIEATLKWMDGRKLTLESVK